MVTGNFPTNLVRFLDFPKQNDGYLKDFKNFLQMSQNEIRPPALSWLGWVGGWVGGWPWRNFVGGCGWLCVVVCLFPSCGQTRGRSVVQIWSVLMKTLSGLLVLLILFKEIEDFYQNGGQCWTACGQCMVVCVVVCAPRPLNFQGPAGQLFNTFSKTLVKIVDFMLGRTNHQISPECMILKIC